MSGPLAPPADAALDALAAALAPRILKLIRAELGPKAPDADEATIAETLDSIGLNLEKSK